MHTNQAFPLLVRGCQNSSNFPLDSAEIPMNKRDRLKQ